MKIVVTGHKGMLGSVLKEQLEQASHEVVGLDLPEYDLLESEKYRDLFKGVDFIYNCAAFTDVDRCEKEEQKALLVNGELVGKLAKELANLRIQGLSDDATYRSPDTASLKALKLGLSEEKMTRLMHLLRALRAEVRDPVVTRWQNELDKEVRY